MKYNSKKPFSAGRAFLIGASVAALLSAVPAHAIQADADPGNPEEAAQAPADEEAAAGGFDDIIVTAQRRSENLQSVPTAISAFSGDQLATAGISNTRDLQLVTPSLAFVQTSFSPQPTIRGIGTRGTNAGDEQVVPIYLDGVYQPFIAGSIFELTNVERVEVLKGPQGTLLGRNATGGAINIITPAPSFDPTAIVKLSYGSFNEVDAAAYVSAGTGPVAASIDARYLRNDGYTRELTTGSRIASVRSASVRGKLLLQAGENTDITIAASYSDRDDNSGISVYPFLGNASARNAVPSTPLPTEERTVVLTFKPELNIRQYAASATLVHRFGGVTLTSITGYSDNLLYYLADVDMTRAAAARQEVTQYDKAWTQDIYLASDNSGPFSWIVGGFYMHDDAGFDPRNLNGGLIYTTLKTDAYAIYAQGAYELTDQLTLTAGGRYSYDKKSATAGDGITTRLPLTKATFENFDPSVTLDYAFTPRTKAYVKYASAFKSGLFNANIFSPTPVQPEHARSFEAGLKTDPLDWLRLNIAAYYTKYTDLQLSARDPVNASVYLQNAASGRIYGFEADTVIRLGEGLNLRGGVSVLNARYNDFQRAATFIRNPATVGGNTPVVIDASGFKLVRVPFFTGTAALDYTVPVGSGEITASANVYYNGGFNWSISGRLKQPEYAMVGAQITYKDGPFSIGAFVKNLTNVQRNISLIDSTLGDQAAWGAPRTGGVRISFEY